MRTRFNNDKIFSVAQNDFAKLPSPISKPTSVELRKLFYKIKTIPSKSTNILPIVTLSDDWRTQ
ncbi:MAG: hypothetical protein LBC74_09525 [Planctomycetaceae bacterium]|nr:hypothetical protein [Planctomycetaceae bacterium]